jgi:hypothetical protein
MHKHLLRVVDWYAKNKNEFDCALAVNVSACNPHPNSFRWLRAIPNVSMTAEKGLNRTSHSCPLICFGVNEITRGTEESMLPCKHLIKKCAYKNHASKLQLFEKSKKYSFTFWVVNT